MYIMDLTWEQRELQKKKRYIIRNFGMVRVSMLESLVPSSTMEVR